MSVAGLPIVEYVFGWGGIGLLALQSIAVKDAAGLDAIVLVLAAFLSLFSSLLDLPRRGAAVRPARRTSARRGAPRPRLRPLRRTCQRRHREGVERFI